MDEDHRVLRTGSGTKLSREQKAGFMFVIVCGLMALVLGGQYLWTHMAEPFSISYTGPRFLTGSEEDAARISEQKRLDTDFDTVSDYDELNIYKTSPYLEDSDSDGLTDDAEISTGQDPNCAPDAPCSSKNNEDVVLSNGTAGLDQEAATLAAQQQALDAALSQLYGLQPAEIRQLLIESGATQAEVTAMTDEEVTLLYQSILQQLEEQGEIDKLIPTSPEVTQ